ncbi:hypothetical protein LPJ66_004018 [Kickxella alabastrina]|uniref:Uncharacterized protein n=1 Tax=Kickxella alabastrina TaxID=61397 RepID=A0ACC1IJ49_9FUNG|nr:hypothetical protein LPJ66_004018 [Kickxella alabastrina]
MGFINKIKLPQRTTWTVAGERRETLFWPNLLNQPPKAVLLLIPGSPGIVDFYIDFCQSLHEQIPSMDIIGVSHLGHTLFEDNRGLVWRNKRVYSLEEQVANMVKVFDEIYEEYKEDGSKPKMLLVAHSVGCYFAQRVIECREELVDRVYSLFPTVEHIAKTPRGKQLELAFLPGVRHFLSLTVDVLRWILPLSFLHQLSDLSGSLNRENSQLVVDKMLHGTCVQNILKMAHDEMHTIKELNCELYGRLGRKFVMYYGVDDGWSPVDHYYKMVKENTEGRVSLCEEGISHAFVTSHSSQMSRIVAEMLRQELGMTKL